MSDKHLAPDTVSDTNPTALHPWTVTLCWSGVQNSGRVSVYPNRHPLHAVWGLLRAGEDHVAVADEHRLGVREVAVLDQLRREVDADLPTRAEVETAVVHDDHCLAYGDLVIPGRPCGCTVAGVLDELVERGWLRLAVEGPGG